MSHKTLDNWESVFTDYLTSDAYGFDDASHDLGHFRRVYQTAKKIAEDTPESVDELVLLASAYFHDIVSLPKDHPENNMSSRFAAKKAKEILGTLGFPMEKIPAVSHAIETHSFSAGLIPETIEAKILQDADRMEALGALGAMRTFYVSGRLGSQPYDPDDFYAKKRPLNDKVFALDHFYVKLYKLPQLLQTNAGRAIAKSRLHFLDFFVQELENNVRESSGGALFITHGCYDAGLQKTKLFDLLDPLATGRELNPNSYVVDKIIAAEKEAPAFLSDFLKQFQEELGI